MRQKRNIVTGVLLLGVMNTAAILYVIGLYGPLVLCALLLLIYHVINH